MCIAWTLHYKTHSLNVHSISFSDVASHTCATACLAFNIRCIKIHYGALRTSRILDSMHSEWMRTHFVVRCILQIGRIRVRNIQTHSQRIRVHCVCMRERVAFTRANACQMHANASQGVPMCVNTHWRRFSFVFFSAGHPIFSARAANARAVIWRSFSHFCACASRAAVAMALMSATVFKMQYNDWCSSRPFAMCLHNGTKWTKLKCFGNALRWACFRMQHNAMSP